MTTTPEYLTDEPLVLGETSLGSRLLVGTGKYADLDETAQALVITGTEMVTVAVRRVDLSGGGPNLLDVVKDRYHVLPNTAGCYDADSAIRTARLARDLLGTSFVKLEVLGDPKTLLPDPVGTLEATRILVEEGFDVMVYTSDDPRLAVRLAELGVVSVMPAGSPIGSGQGILNPNNIRIILERAEVPVIVDAGVGTASDVADELEHLIDATDADGFQFAPTYYAPDYFRTIADHLVPELQRRGRVRTGYAGNTLRENLLD